MERNNDTSEDRIHRYLGYVRYIIVVFSNVLTTLHQKRLHPVLTIDNTKYHFYPENPYLWFFHTVQFYVLLYPGDKIMGCIFVCYDSAKVWVVLLYIAYQYDLYCHYL